MSHLKWELVLFLILYFENISKKSSKTSACVIFVHVLNIKLRFAAPNYHENFLLINL